MSRPVLYPFLRTLARLIAGVYFRRIEVVGAENVPARGPVILAANHPQSITDAMILGLASRRIVHYVAHSGLFANPVLRFLLESGGAIPVHRSTDVQDARTRNEQTFAACRDVLAHGGCIGIFPEGTSAQERRVQRFKTGTVRIALQTEDHHDFSLGVTIVPVGLSFQSALNFRSRVLVTFGEPIVVRDVADDYRVDPEPTVHALTDRLQERIRHQVVDVRRQELDDLVRQVERVYAGELLAREGLEIPGHSRFERELKLSREIARATDHFYRIRPEVIWNVKELLAEYHRRLDRLRLPDRIVRDEPSSFRGEAVRLAVVFVLGLPVAAWGALWNYIPYKLTGIVARMITRDLTKIHWSQLLVGTVLFVAFYAAWFAFALEHFGTVGQILFMASLPPAGIFTRWYVGSLVRRRRHLRWAYLQSTRRLVVQRVLDLRREIIRAMDAALEEHLAHTGRTTEPVAESRHEDEGHA
ncbi:MAG TPA: lysophospholipid acyltransferase family protein [Candidatus Krumholzibacteria bacterium]|nr:lysophospholipid acyltransferase family protein [Candidatus Krumholzibacteria bacterium]